MKAIHFDVATEEIEIINAVLPTQVPPFEGTTKIYLYTRNKEKPNLSSTHCVAMTILLDVNFSTGKLDYNTIYQPSSNTRLP